MAYQMSECVLYELIFKTQQDDSRPLEDGDIVNIDVTIYLNGYHGDTSSTFLVGDVVRNIPQNNYIRRDLLVRQDESGRELVQMTNVALEAGIDACGPGRPFNCIGRAIYEVVRNTRHSVCPAFAGHGIGTVFHRPPWIYHTRKSTFCSCVKDFFEIFFAVNEEPGVMLPGHCFTIEANSSAHVVTHC
jgi:methionyl aminopeptidase